MPAKWTKTQIKQFADAAQSLKLYRRAELVDDDTQNSLIEILYVDPLPNNGILNALLRPNTTFLIGRKGTGKSTIFQRAQHDIRKQKNSLSAYLDIKTIFESADVDPVLLDKLGTQPTAMSATSVRQSTLLLASSTRDCSISAKLISRLFLIPSWQKSPSSCSSRRWATHEIWGTYSIIYTSHISSTIGQLELARSAMLRENITKKRLNRSLAFKNFVTTRSRKDRQFSA